MGGCRMLAAGALVKRGLRRGVLLACVLAGIQGCSTVQPWERGNLARKEMSPSPTPALSGLRGHIFFSREGSQGGHAGTGGGCGCN